MLLLSFFKVVQPLQVQAAPDEEPEPVLIYDVTVPNYYTSNVSFTVNKNLLGIQPEKYRNAHAFEIPFNNSFDVHATIDGQVRIDSFSNSKGRRLWTKPSKHDVGKTHRIQIYVYGSVDDINNSSNSDYYLTDVEKTMNSINSLGYRINALNTSIQAISSDLYELSIQISNITTAINNQTTQLTTVINNQTTKITNAITNQTTSINNTINSMKTELSSKLTNIDNSIKSIHSELQTNQTVESNRLPDIDDILDETTAEVPQNGFIDDTIYFEDAENVIVDGNMPDLPSIEKWDGVENEKEQEQDNELTKESELVTDEEIKKEQELKKEDFKIEDQLEQDNFSKDNELTQDSFEIQDFSKTENYDQDNQFNQNTFFEKQPDLEQTEKNHKARWQSINGQFQ